MTDNQHTHQPFISPGTELTEEVLKAQESKFLELLNEVLEKAEEYNVIMRVIGSIAFRIKCPDYKYMEYENKRYLTDIDFIVYNKDIVKVQDLFFDLDWSENQTVLRLFGDKRRIFYHPEVEIHSDIFIDKLRFCHEINFKNRLEIDYPTISLVDLLLEKLQIVEINKKDLVDTMILLSQYDVSTDGSEKDVINGRYLSRLTSRNWGWWRTATMNLKKTHNFAGEYLNQKDSKLVRNRIEKILNLIASTGKSLSWKLRSIFGDRFKWYRDVEELQRD